MLLGVLTKNEHLLDLLNTEDNNKKYVNKYLNCKSIEFLKYKNIIKSKTESNNFKNFLNNHNNLHKHLILYTFFQNKNKS